MIEVKCNCSRWNTHREMYQRFGNRMSLIQLNIDENGVKFEMELNVAEAEQLANDIMEWARDIKGDEEESA